MHRGLLTGNRAHETSDLVVLGAGQSDEGQQAHEGREDQLEEQRAETAGSFFVHCFESRTPRED